ncbi:MAG: hypothetical protein C4K58_04890 [Flavobacteriaceae bacterium]|nr:MAG: hypothetical protein C4K58_04890 [Flavobacteriaceae bacterium]
MLNSGKKGIVFKGILFSLFLMGLGIAIVGRLILDHALCQMFGKPKSYFEKKLRAARKEGNQYLLIVKGLEYQNYLKVKKMPILNKGKFKGGLIVEKNMVRIHPNIGIGERTIGYDNEKGKAGLEGAYSDYLQGIDGKRVEQRITSKDWKPINYWNKKDPIEGSDVFTTIEPSLQQVAYQSLLNQLLTYQAHHGSVVVMEVETGEVKAMVNLTRSKDGSYKDTRNYAVWEAVEPGSTFKTASLLIAMEDGYITPETSVETGDGSYTFNNGSTIKDSHPLGTISVTKVLEESSNIGTAKLINNFYKKNPKKFISRLEDWNLTQRLGITIPGEGEPFVPTPSWSNWNNITLPWMSFGYNIKLTPLQILSFYNGIANDGKIVKPMFIKKIEHRGKKIAERVFIKTPTKRAVKPESAKVNIEKAIVAKRKVQISGNAMPNLRGEQGRTAISELENKGIRVIYSGTGKVIKQSILPYSPIKKGQVVYLELEK